MARAGTGYIRALDGLRGLAILPVTAYHYIGWNLPLFGAAPGTALFSRLIDRGALGVTLFFALSGYLITGILLDGKGARNWIPKFLAKRALRIFPLYYLALAALFFWVPFLLHSSAYQLYPRVAEQQGWLWSYASNLRIAQANTWSYCSASPCAYGLDINHFWSLAVEEHFYLVWPLLVWACSRRVLAWSAVGLSLSAILLRACFLSLPGGRYLFAAHVFTPCCMDALLLGALPAILLREPGLRGRVLRWFPWLLFAPLLSFAIPAGLARDSILPSLQALAFAACVVTCAHAPAEGRLARAIGCAPLVFFGRISYGLYVVHAPLHDVWRRLVPPETLVRMTHSPLLGVGLFWLIALLFSTAVAFLSFHLFEKRLLLLKRFFETARPELASASQV